jgi:hypothetical protein
MTGNSTAMILEETTQDSFIKKQSADRPSSKKKSTIHLNVQKYCSGHTSTQKNITAIVQDSGTGSKPLITLSAMGFISATYSENCSSEQPTTTPSPIGD